MRARCRAWSPTWSLCVTPADTGQVEERVLRQFAEHCQQATRTGRSQKKPSTGFSTAVTCERPRCGATRWRYASWPSMPTPPAGMLTPRPRWPGSVSVISRRMCSATKSSRLFAAIDCQGMSSYSNKALVNPVLFRVLCGAGLRISEALNLWLPDMDTRAGTLRIRDTKNGESRTVPITHRLAATLDGYVAAARPSAREQ